jgi:hypothetical protein
VKDEAFDDMLKKAAEAPHDLSPEMLQRIAESIKPSLLPVRPLPPTWVFTGKLVLVSAAISLAGAARAGFLGFEQMDVLKRSLIFPTLLVLAWVAGSAFVHEMIPASLRRISPGTLLASSCAALLGVFAFLFRDYETDHFVPLGIACLLTGLLHAIASALLGWLLLRRGLALNSISAGFVAGTLGGLAGVGVLELHCPNFEAAHVLLWHVAVVPLSSATGALVGLVLHLCSNPGAPGRNTPG